MNTMKVTVTTIERTVFYSDCIIRVNMPTLGGRVTVLPDHEPMITAAGLGEIELSDFDNNPLHLFIDGGVIQVLGNNVEILAEMAEKADEMEDARIQEAIRRATEIIAENPGDVDVALMEAIIERENEKFKYLKKWEKLKS